MSEAPRRPRRPVASAAVLVLAWVAAGVLNTPAMTLLSDGIEARGLDHGVGFAVIYLVSAGGQGVGAIAGGLLAARVSDAATYLALAVLCGLTLASLARGSRFTTANLAGPRTRRGARRTR